MPFDESGHPGPPRGAGQRAINLPPVLLWLIGINVAVHLVRELLSDAADQRHRPAVRPGARGLHRRRRARPAVAADRAPFTYQFLHGGWLHLGINMLTLAAFGAPVERVLGARRFLAFYLSAGIVAGFVHVFFFPNSADPVVGASGAISGVFGGVLILMRYVGSMPSLLPIAGIWIALNVFFGIVGGTPGAGGDPVAWTAHIGGFVYGLAGHPPLHAASGPVGRAAMADQPIPLSRYLAANAVALAPSGRGARRPLLVGRARRPAGPDRVGGHRGGDGLPGAALSRLARPLRPLRRRTVGRARAGDAAPVLRAGHRGARDGGGDARHRLAPPARLDRQSRGLRPGDRRRPARSADRRRPPAPHRAHQPRGAWRCSARSAPNATCRRRCAIPQLLSAIDCPARDRARRQFRRGRPERGRVRAGGRARARCHRPSPAPAARGGRRLAGADRAARHHGAAPGRAHARRFRRQCQPRAQDADRRPRGLHRDPARAGARRCRGARALPRHHGRAGRPHAPPGRRPPDAVAHRAARACAARPRVDLGACCAGVRDLLQLKASSRSVAVELAVAAGLPRRSATTTSSPSCSRT